MQFLNQNLSKKQLRILEIGTIFLFCVIPLFFSFPYKINIYLAWEGAFRISEGQLPFRDFGMPLGYTFWILPAVFFKIFGPYMLSLIKAQVFINLVSLFILRSIMKLLDINPTVRYLTLLLFCISYVFINFWPWYNHTVFVVELVGLYFLLKSFFESKVLRRYSFLVLGSLFIFLGLFTKQDIGGLGLMFALFLVVYHALVNKEIKSLLIFIVAITVIGAIIIIPLLQYDFGYWFNYGQDPHYSRVNSMDYLNDLFSDSSTTIRLYFILVLIVGLARKQPVKYYLEHEKEGLILLMTMGILTQVILAQVTSYIPANSHFYYHTFVFLFIAHQISKRYDLGKIKILILGIIMIFFWQSSDYWKYGKRILTKIVSIDEAPDYSRVSKRTWNLRKLENSKKSQWVKSEYKSLQGIYIPKPTLEGIQRLEQNAVFRKEDPKVLNMTELTSLAYEFNFDLEASPQQPLWYHKNVAFFDREVNYLCSKISNGYYDLVLFEDIPDLNEFYSYDVRDCLEEHYQLTDEFLAPRTPETARILVFERNLAND